MKTLVIFFSLVISTAALASADEIKCGFSKSEIDTWTLTSIQHVMGQTNTGAQIAASTVFARDLGCVGECVASISQGLASVAQQKVAPNSCRIQWTAFDFYPTSVQGLSDSIWQALTAN